MNYIDIGLILPCRQLNLTCTALLHIISDMRYALDTDVLVAGLRSATGASHRLLELLDEERFEIVANVSMMLEYESVLKEPDHLRAAGFTAEEIDQFLDSLALLIIPVPSFYLWRPALRDPADEHVLEAAINGRADAVVTFNTRHFAQPARRFGIELLRPGEALRRLAR